MSLTQEYFFSDYCETLEQSAEVISSQLDHRTGDEKVLSYDTVEGEEIEIPKLAAVQ